MPKRTLESLGALIKAKRGDRPLRATAQEIGIGPATLMRVQNGHTPDLNTFGKICNWLDVDPGEFLRSKQGASTQQAGRPLVSAHFRADRTLPTATVDALAKMITLAAGMQPQQLKKPYA